MKTNKLQFEILEGRDLPSHMFGHLAVNHGPSVHAAPQAIIATTPVPTADVGVTMNGVNAAGSTFVQGGDSLFYTITVTNNGPDPTIVHLTTTSSGVKDIIWFGGYPLTATDIGMGTGNIDTTFSLASGQKASFVEIGHVAVADGTVANAAQVATVGAVDLNDANNIDAVTLTVV